MYVDEPHYNAMLFRRTYADLAKPGALMSRLHEWLGGMDCAWNSQQHRWTFPSGATVGFGHLDQARHKYEYQGSELQFCGFDELTQFHESDYRYLFSRIRRSKHALLSRVPLRMRAASNPGGIGHEWVNLRFRVQKAPGRVFMPALLRDNPSLDPREYLQMLAELDPVTRRQLEHGDWDSRPTGGMFARSWFIDPARGRFLLPEWPSHVVRSVRYWDLAATEVKPGTDPDFTAGALVGLMDDGRWVVGDIRRVRATPANVQRLIAEVAEMDGKRVAVRIEQEPGASGVTVIDHYARNVLRGYDFKGYRATGSKSDRARPVSAAAELGNVLLVRGPWVNAFLDEADAFPLEGAHDDQVDAVSGAIADMTAPPNVVKRRDLLL